MSKKGYKTMLKHQFPVPGRKPCIELKSLDGNLTLHSWANKEIRIEAAAPIQKVELDGDTLKLEHSRGDITITIPLYKELFSWVTTKVEGEKLGGKVAIEGAGDVKLKDIGGPVLLENISGNVELEEMREMIELTSVSGDLEVKKAAIVRAGKVSKDVKLRQIHQAELESIDGDLDAKNIARALHCQQVGGNAQVDDCRFAEIFIPSVGGNLGVDEAARMLSSSANGNMSIKAHFASDREVHLRAGKNMTIKLPDGASVQIQVTHVGGSMSGSNLPPRTGGSPTLLYGRGQALVELWVGGNLTVKE